MTEEFKFDFARDDMIDKTVSHGAFDPKLVLNAMRAAPGEVFLPAQLREFAYQGSPLPIEGRPDELLPAEMTDIGAGGQPRTSSAAMTARNFAWVSAGS